MHIFDISEMRDCLIMKDYHLYRFRQNLRHRRQANIVLSWEGASQPRYCSMPYCNVKVTSQRGRVRTYSCHVVIGR